MTTGSRPGRTPTTVSTQGWLTSFTDLLCLLLTFFILSFSMTEPDYQRWQAMFGAPDGAPTPGVEGALFSVASIDEGTAANLDYLAALLRSHLASEPATAALQVERVPGAIRIPMPTQWTIPVDGGEVDGETGKALFYLGAALARIGNRVEIIGEVRENEAVGEAVGDRLAAALQRAVVVAGALTDAGLGRPLAVRAEADAGGVSAPTVVIVIRDWRDG